MITSKVNVKQVLEKLYGRYNKRALIKPDPLQFVYRYRRKKDREVVALLSALLAYGRVAQIENSLNKLFDIMGESPAEFTLKLGPAQIRKLSIFKHRFNTGKDITDLLKLVRQVYENHKSLEDFFAEKISENHQDILPATTLFCNDLHSMHEKMTGNKPGKGLSYLVSDPGKKSACKRLNLFLRWMVRKDQVDPGTWKSIDKKLLLVPIDTHMARLTRFLGFHNRNSADLKTAIMVTKAFAEICPDDPVKYDFALSRIGIVENCTGKYQEKCNNCQLIPFCRLRLLSSYS